jgi:integrase
LFAHVRDCSSLRLFFNKNKTMCPFSHWAVRWHPRKLLVLFVRNTNTPREKTNMPLTDAKLRALKPAKGAYKIADGEGLYIRVTSSGGRLWAIAYRYGGKQKSLSIGKYPIVSLLDARRARDEAKRLLASGIDPSAARKKERRQRTMASANTFEAVANEWFSLNSERWVQKYSVRLRSRLDDDLLPALGHRPISEIEPLEVLDAIRKIEKRDAIEMGRRVMQMAGSIFRYGVATARCSRDITADLKGALRPPKQTKHRTALPASELPTFVKALQNYDGDEVTKLAMQLLLLTFVRTSEVRFARWSEFEGLDSANALWRIPAGRMKMRRDHLVPLSPQAVSIVKRLRSLSKSEGFVFPGGNKDGVMSENTLLFAIYRMGYHKRATVHGFRATASTILNEAQFNRDWIEMQLAHFDNSVRGIYNSAEWLPQRQSMKCWWADYLEGTRRKRLEAVASF